MRFTGPLIAALTSLTVLAGKQALHCSTRHYYTGRSYAQNISLLRWKLAGGNVAAVGLGVVPVEGAGVVWGSREFRNSVDLGGKGGGVFATRVWLTGHKRHGVSSTAV